jgi:hypothetical protein
MSPMKTLLALALALTGCVDVAETPCERDARSFCDRLGFPSETCFAAMAQSCSPERAEDARQMCLELHPELGADDECTLEWR